MNLANYNTQTHTHTHKLIRFPVPQWPTCMTGSRDTAGGQDLRNRNRKCMESADSMVQSQLYFVIKTMNGTQTFCGYSIEDYL